MDYVLMTFVVTIYDDNDDKVASGSFPARSWQEAEDTAIEMVARSEYSPLPDDWTYGLEEY